MFLKLFQKFEEVPLPNSFYEESISLIPKSNKDTSEENYRLVSRLNGDARFLNTIDQMHHTESSL